MTFGEKLSELLEERNISQKEFAETLSIAPTTLNGYIKDKRQPDFETVRKITSALNVSADYLLDTTEKSFKITSNEFSLISKLRTLSNEQQKMVYDLVDVTVKNNKNKTP